MTDFVLAVIKLFWACKIQTLPPRLSSSRVQQGHGRRALTGECNNRLCTTVRDKFHTPCQAAADPTRNCSEPWRTGSKVHPDGGSDALNALRAHDAEHRLQKTSPTHACMQPGGTTTTNAVQIRLSGAQGRLPHEAPYKVSKAHVEIAHVQQVVHALPADTWPTE